MRQRILSLLLALTLLVGLLPVTASAEEEAKLYGEVPIYFGDVYIDYMAQEILKEIDLEGKTDEERIRAVYDWVIVNCERESEADKLYFDLEKVEKQANGKFYEYMVDAIAEGEITLRIDVGGELTTYDPESGMYFLSCDSNEYVAYSAGPMMLYRVGECHNFAALLLVLLGHLGYDCRLIDGEFINNDGSQVMHKWNMVLLDGKYVWLDVRMDHANYKRTGTLDHTYFLVEDQAAWEKKHSWDHGYSDAMMENAQLLVETYGMLLDVPGMVEENQKTWSTCSQWAEPYLQKSLEKDIYPDVFVLADLTQDVTRAEFASVAVMFYEALSGKTVAYDAQATNPFTDVTAADADVLTAYQLGIVNGMSADKFAPAGTLTREQAVTMLGRVVELVKDGKVGDGSGLKKGDAEVPAFSDAGKIGAWAKNYVDYFVSHGVVQGMGDGGFAPASNMTREQAMKVAVEALGQ